MHQVLLFIAIIYIVLLIIDRIKSIMTPIYKKMPLRNIKKIGLVYPRNRININTRGTSNGYIQIGTLHEKNSTNTNSTILPLYGKQTYPRSSKWYYYTLTDQQNSVKLPVFNNTSRNCQEEYGCSELYDKDEVNINAYSKKFIFNRYIKNKPQYIPYIL
jgi:hypothetical protein